MLGESANAARRTPLPITTPEENKDSLVSTRRPSGDVAETEWGEAAQLNAAYMWRLVFAALAECVTTCYLPSWLMLGWNINVTATMINMIGPFVDGLAQGYEELVVKANLPSPPILQYRAAFFGVFTSYSFMVDHAGDLSTNNLVVGPLYVCASIVGGCLSFHLGKFLFLVSPLAQPLNKRDRESLAKQSPYILACFGTVIVATVLRAVLGAPGFVRDPKDPQFIATFPVADGEELVLGILMSCSGVLIADELAARAQPQPDRSGHVSVLDWSNLVCNFLACWLTVLAYEGSKVAPNAIKNNLLVSKFVSSFCGSLSGFAASVGQITLMWQAGNRRGAYWNFMLQIVTGLLFLPYLHKRTPEEL